MPSSWPGHAAHLLLEGLVRLAEGDEHQAGLHAHHPGHGAAQHEGLGVEAFLRGALDVRGLRRVLQLLVVRQAPAEVVVARPRRPAPRRRRGRAPTAARRRSWSRRGPRPAPCAKAASSASSPSGFSVPSSKPVRSWPWPLSSSDGGRHRPRGARAKAGASAFCTLRVTCSRSPRSSPRSQHHSVPGVDGTFTPSPREVGEFVQVRESRRPAPATSDGPMPTHHVAAVDQRRQARQRLLDGAGVDCRRRPG